MKNTVYIFGPPLHAEMAEPPPPANDNYGVKPDWMTPAELMQWVRHMKAVMRQELQADFTLRNCPKHRRHWEAVHAIERFARWHYYRKRQE